MINKAHEARMKIVWFYGRKDGTFVYPNNMDGDLLKLCKEALEQQAEEITRLRELTCQRLRR